jgi:hypothetical protein
MNLTELGHGAAPAQGLEALLGLRLPIDDTLELGPSWLAMPAKARAQRRQALGHRGSRAPR